MNIRWKSWIVAIALVLVPLSASADDVTGVTKILCAATEATVCTFEGECEIGSPWQWNIPSFVVIDLDAQTIGTTGASKDQRRSEIKQLQRDDEHVVLQGYENGRAFSFVIHIPTGEMTVAVARDGVAVSAFGMCTSQDVGQ